MKTVNLVERIEGEAKLNCSWKNGIIIDGTIIIPKNIELVKTEKNVYNNYTLMNRSMLPSNAQCTITGRCLTPFSFVYSRAKRSGIA